jgi:hypothetical protein
MSKDQITWQISCLIEEIKLLNDRIICGDYTPKGAEKMGKEWGADLQQRLKDSPDVAEAWVSVAITYGGTLSMSWQISFNDGDKVNGNVTPIRRSL